MKALFKTEFYKIIHSYQMKIISISIFIYVGILPFFLLSPGSYTVFERYRNVTSDIAVMTILISLMSSTVFASEYTEKTLKYLIEYHKRYKIFLAKIIVILFGIIALLTLWYFLGILVVMLQTQSIPEPVVLQNFIKRFSIQGLFIIMQGSLLLLLSILVKKQALVNIASFVIFFILSFSSFYQWILANYHWGSWGIPSAYMSLLLITILFFTLSYFIFSRQEIRG